MWKRDHEVTISMLRRLPDPSLIALMAAVATRLEPIGRGVVAAGGPDWEVERRVDLLWGWSEAPNRDAAGDEMVVVMRAEPAQPGPGSSAVERASFAVHMALTGLFIAAFGVDGTRDRELFELMESTANGIRDLYGRTWPWLVPGEQAAQLSDVAVLRSGGRLSAAVVRESAAYQERLQADPKVWLDLAPVQAPQDEDLDKLVGKVEALLPRLSDRSLGGLLWVWAVACSVEAEFASEEFEELVEECLAAVEEWVVAGRLGGEAVERLRLFPEVATREGFVPGAGLGEAGVVVRLVVAASRLIVADDLAGAREELLAVAREGAGLDSTLVGAVRRLARVKVPSARLLDRLAATVTE